MKYSDQQTPIEIYIHVHVVGLFCRKLYCIYVAWYIGGGSPSISLAPLSEYRSSSEVKQVVGGAPPDHTHHTFGVPTIRSDLPAPRIKRVGDNKVSM